MTHEAAEQAIAKLNEVGPSVALTFMMGAESYFEVMTSLVDNYCHEHDLGCIYVAMSVPAPTIISALDSLEVNRSHVRFIDCISIATMQSSSEASNIVYVESPEALEYIILKMEYFFRKSDGKRMMVVVDSANALAMHNESRILTDFIQVLMSSLKNKEAYPIILALGENLRADVKETLALVSDQVVMLGMKTD